MKVSVKEHGAMGDGTTDDAPAIRAGLAALQALGGGCLLFPAGTYLLNSYGSTFGPLDFVAEFSNNIHLLGMPGAKLKLADGFIESSTNTEKGNIFKALNCDNVSIEGLEIDFNGANNLATQAPWHVYGLYAVNTDHVAVRRCYWYDNPGFNYVVSYGVAASWTPSATGFIVEDCDFRNGGTSIPGNTLQRDFSAVYSTNFGTRISRIRVRHDERPWTYCGGIELHASDSQISECTVEDSYPAVYLGQTPSVIDEIKVRGNNFKNCHSGVVFPTGRSSSGDYSHIDITGNTATLLRFDALDTDYHSDFVLQSAPAGTLLTDWTDYPFTIRHLNISNNTVESLNGTEADAFTTGISLSSVFMVDIHNNQFYNLSGAPFRLLGSPYSAQHVRFVGNACVDFGNHNHVTNPRFGVGMFLLGSSITPSAAAYRAENVAVENNMFALSSVLANASVAHTDFSVSTTLTNWMCRNNQVRNITSLSRGTHVEDAPVDMPLITSFGAVGDGVTNDSAAIQACINANKAKTVIIPDGTFLCSGLLMSGSTYSGTRLICQGGILKLAGDAGSGNYPVSSPVMWTGLVVHDCSDIFLDLVWDGNRTAMTASQFLHCVVLAGAHRVHAARMEFREIRGDGLNITQENVTGPSMNSSDIVIGDLVGYNSADDGRNLLSLISGERITVDQVHSYQIGGLIGAHLMPGGLDIECDEIYQSVSDVTVGNVNVTTAGTSGVQVAGKSSTGKDADRAWNCQRIRISNFILRRTGETANADMGSLAATNFVRCLELDVQGQVTYWTDRGAGFLVDYCDSVRARLHASYVTNGVQVGVLQHAFNVDIQVTIADYTTVALLTGSLSHSKLTGRITQPVRGSNAVAIQTSSGGQVGGETATQINVSYSVDVPFDSGASLPTRAFQNSPGFPVSYTDVEIRDCAFTDYPSLARFNDPDTLSPPKRNVRGISSTAKPAAGRWRAGEYVPNSSPSVIAGSKSVMGWFRVTDGTGHEDGRDWIPVYAG